MSSVPRPRPRITATRLCLACGSPFLLRNPNQRYCDDACRYRHRFGPPRPCGQCGTVFQPRWAGADYCCVACHDLAQRRGPDLVCEHCGLAFRRRDTLSKAYRPRFCSTDGRVAHTRYTAVCLQCGVTFERQTPSLRRRYCSVRCSADARRSPLPRRKHGYDRRYNEWRAAVLARDKVCQDCGAVENLHVHHIKGWTPFPDLRYEVTNGMVLCATCHQRRHKGHGVGRHTGSRSPLLT